MLNQTNKSILGILIFWVTFGLVLYGLRAFPPNLFQNWTMLFIGCLLVGVSLLLVALFLKREHRSFVEVGFDWTTKSRVQLIQGTLAGIAVVGVMLGVIIATTSVTVERVPNPDYWNSVGYAALILFVLALMEEVVFRSYPLFRLSENLGVRSSIYITSILFAFYHGLNPSNLLGPGVWGLFFGLAAIWTKGIALPLGFHFGLNWMQSLFGMKVQYASSIWTVVPGEQHGFFTTEAVGLSFQIILLVLGVTLIEIHVKKKPQAKR